MTTTRTDDLGRLMAHIFNHEQRGERVPCVDPRIGHRWLSDDPTQTEAAIHACRSLCPALDACAEYVAAHAEPAGVWAGRPPHKERTTRR